MVVCFPLRGMGAQCKTGNPAWGRVPGLLPASLLGDNILRCRPLGAFDHVKGDALAFLQALEALGLDGSMMDKYVLAAILLDSIKPKPLESL